MSKMIPVEGHKNLYRDEKTNAILNSDKVGYDNYVRMRNKNKDREKEMKSMKDEIEELKSLLNELATKITS